jgi:hypothetical protein
LPCLCNVTAPTLVLIRLAREARLSPTNTYDDGIVVRVFALTPFSQAMSWPIARYWM